MGQHTKPEPSRRAKTTTPAGAGKQRTAQQTIGAEGAIERRTLSARLRSHLPVSSSRRTMCVWPCSLAHIRAVEPSRSCAFTSAPMLRSSFTMATRPWLTASMSAVWPASRKTDRGREGEREGENYREAELSSERGDVGGR